MCACKNSEFGINADISSGCFALKAVETDETCVDGVMDQKFCMCDEQTKPTKLN